MNLAAKHPVQLVFGGLLIAEELAAKNRQLTLGVLCAQAQEWADHARSMFELIARDAGDGTLLVSEVARDGLITPIEARQLTRQFERIQTEAREGRRV